MSKAKFTKGKWVARVCDNSIKTALVYLSDKGGFDVSGAPNCIANAHLISKAPEMYKMLESVANELYMLIDEVNDQRASRITPQTECEPDYHDMQTIHEIQCLLAEARGVDVESS